MDIVKILEENASKLNNRPAVIFKDQLISFFQLKENSFKLANALINLGIKKGDKVAVYLPNCLEYIYSYLAIWCCGATAVPLDFMLTEDELISCLSHAEAKVLILKHKANISIEKLKKNIVSLQNIIVCRETIAECLSLGELLGSSGAEIGKTKYEERDYAIIFYTSGTTGKPKGVLINYLQLGAPPKAMGFFINADARPGDTAICALPLSHLGGLNYILNQLIFGYTFILMERFIPLEFLKAVERYKANFFWIVPSMYYAILQLKEFETFDLSSLRWIVSFGASNSPEALGRFHHFCPKAHLLNGWGLTETNAPTCVMPIGSNKIESVGRPAPWIEVKIFADNGTEAPKGQVGEIAVRGWAVTDGYFKDPALTAEILRNDWFHTGDLGRFDSEGDLYIVGRKKEMLKVAGEIVFEPEVEAVIHKHPAVAEVAVIGAADKLRGEVPKAFVVLKQGNSVTEEDLKYFCRQHLAHFKIPHYFEFKDTLPKNRTGKIDKESLRRG